MGFSSIHEESAFGIWGPNFDNFSGDAFLHLGEVPSVQVSPHHWRPSDTAILSATSLERQCFNYHSSFIELTEDKNGCQRLKLALSPKSLFDSGGSLSNPRFEAPSWDQIYGMLISLAVQVRKSGFKPEVIVGVSRGGWPPARVMSDLLENQNLANMKVVFYKDIGVPNKRPVITQPVTSKVSGKRVLVVDDVSDSGHSLRAVANHLRRRGAREIRVCTLYVKPDSVFVPDYYARKTSKWIIFPWERLEAVRLLAKKAVAQGAGTGTVVEKLKGSGLSARLVKQLLRVSLDAGEN